MYFRGLQHFLSELSEDEQEILIYFLKKGITMSLQHKKSLTSKERLLDEYKIISEKTYYLATHHIVFKRYLRNSGWSEKQSDGFTIYEQTSGGFNKNIKITLPNTYSDSIMQHYIETAISILCRVKDWDIFAVLDDIETKTETTYNER